MGKAKYKKPLPDKPDVAIKFDEKRMSEYQRPDFHRWVYGGDRNPLCDLGWPVKVR
jgi:hypothetical protein